MKMPNRSIIDENDLSSQRQYKFSQDRYSGIHQTVLNSDKSAPKYIGKYPPNEKKLNNLNAVQEENHRYGSYDV